MTSPQVLSLLMYQTQEYLMKLFELKKIKLLTHTVVEDEFINLHINLVFSYYFSYWEDQNLVVAYQSHLRTSLEDALSSYHYFIGLSLCLQIGVWQTMRQ